MAMSFTPGLPYWYEINIYRTSEQRFVLAIRLFHVAEDQKDTVDAWAFDTLHEVFDALEAHDAGRDVIADVDTVQAECPPGELAVRAWELRARIEAARHHFAGLVGELLAEIDAVADAA
jgi:RPA family protein